jgi:hypothetical protein
MRLKRYPNPSVRTHAQEFAHASKVLFEEGGSLDGAAIVNGVFAIELYLKALNADVRYDEPFSIGSGGL